MKCSDGVYMECLKKLKKKKKHIPTIFNEHFLLMIFLKYIIVHIILYR